MGYMRRASRQPCGENGEEWASLAVLPLKLLKKLPKVTTWPCAVLKSSKETFKLLKTDGLFGNLGVNFLA
jgi:hypothetical protein